MGKRKHSSGSTTSSDAKKRKKRRKEASSSGTSGSTSSTSRKKKKKKSKKKRKDRKSKKSKKKTKKKKKGKRKQARKPEHVGNIQVGDQHKKEPEFRLYLEEVKKVLHDDLSADERAAHWEAFVEDYNTGKMAHEKYYGLQQYLAKRAFIEEALAAKKMEEKRKELGLDEKEQPKDADDDERIDFDDERALERDRAESREKKRLDDLREESRKAVAVAQAKEAITMGRIGAVAKGGGIHPTLHKYL